MATLCLFEVITTWTRWWACLLRLQTVNTYFAWVKINKFQITGNLNVSAMKTIKTVGSRPRKIQRFQKTFHYDAFEIFNEIM